MINQLVFLTNGVASLWWHAIQPAPVLKESALVCAFSLELAPNVRVVISMLIVKTVELKASPCIVILLFIDVCYGQ